MKKRNLVVVSLLLFAAIVFLCSQGTERLLALATPGTQPESFEYFVEKELDHPFAEAGSSRAEVTTETIRGAPAEGKPAPDPRVDVRVVSKDSGEALEGIQLIVSKSRTGASGVHVEGPRGRPGELVESDEDGRGSFDLPPGEGFFLHVVDSGVAGATHVEPLPSMERGETRLVTIGLPTKRDLILHARVLDAETRAPVIGARVRLIQPGYTVYDGEKKDGSRLVDQTESGANGSFVLEIPSWRVSLMLRIEREGYGLALAHVSKTNPNPEDPQEVFVSREGTLDAQVRFLGETWKGGTRIRVTAETHDLMQRLERPERPGIFTIIVGFLDPTWESEVPENGLCRLDGLPANVSLAVEIRRGSEVLWRRGRPLEFAPGETMTEVITLGR